MIDDLKILSDPNKWPLDRLGASHCGDPLLARCICLKREFGKLPGLGHVDSQDPLTVIARNNISDMAHVKMTYASVEAMLADGWVVD